MFGKKLISCGLSPNLEVKDVILSVKLILSPHRFKVGRFPHKVESWFRRRFKVNYAYSFASGREAEYAILASLNIKKSDEILVQAFTCAAVAYPILVLGAKPVYVDIDTDTYCMDVSNLEKKISPKTKAVIVQHTFGIPANVEKIRNIAKKHNIYLIEDCAHGIGGKIDNKLLGTFGDAAFFSFGRDKAVSSVFGGMAITNNSAIGENIKSIYESSSYPSSLWIFQQLLHPILTWLVLLFFQLSPLLGKTALGVVKKTRILSSPVTYWEENSSNKKQLKRFSNALATLAFSQLERLDRFNTRRLQIYNIYRQHIRKQGLTFKDIKLPERDAFYLRIPIRVKEKNKFIDFFKKDLIYLGDWYSHIIDPKGSRAKVGYSKGECLRAEKASGQIVNLPCNPTLNNKGVERVLRVLSQYDKRQV